MRFLAVFAVTVWLGLGAPGDPLAWAASAVSPPAQYQATEHKLEPSCGAARARAISNLSWDVDIHQQWAAIVQRDPSQAKTVGDVAWHRYWVAVYRQAITLLLRDCGPAPVGL